MTKKLLKIATGVGMAISSLYWGVLPGFALSLCTNTDAQGVNVQGLCGLTVEAIVPKVISTILFVAFVAALIFLIIGGVKWIISGGDKEGTTKAKETVTSALIGLAVVLGSWILINIILRFFGSTGGLTTLTMPSLL